VFRVVRRTNDHIRKQIRVLVFVVEMVGIGFSIEIQFLLCSINLMIQSNGEINYPVTALVIITV